jgi:hypothetical protein
MFTKSKDHNPNYLASIVQVKNLRAHSNADRLRVCSVYGNNVITGLDSQEDDIVVFFPIEAAISKEFLSWSNAFEDKTLNKDTEKKGYFNKHGRVRAITLRGEKSEGYIVPRLQVELFFEEEFDKPIFINEKHIGTDFDEIEGHQMCKKYVPLTRQAANPNKKKSKGNVKKYESKLVDGQFHFHFDTQHLKRNMHRVSPDDFVAITNKLHGTSFVVSNVLTKKRLNFVQRIISKFVPLVDTEYGMLYSSRKVIKNKDYLVKGDNGGFYKEDVWQLVADKVFPMLKAGISVYGEIVGYLPSGKAIQKTKDGVVYDYGCKECELDFYVYRVTSTNAKGDVFEYSHKQVENWCAANGVKQVPLFYYGKAKDMFPEIATDQHWHENVLNKLIEVYLEGDCTICVNTLPAEGVVLTIDFKPEYDAFKLKSFRFLQKETENLDAGNVDIETEESDNAEQTEEA